MGKLIIDAHSHLWLRQDTTVDGGSADAAALYD